MSIPFSKRAALCFLALSLILLTGCSNKALRNNPLVQDLLAKMTARYLDGLANNRGREIQSLMNWDEYSSNNTGLTNTKFQEEIIVINKRWAPDRSPLFHLSIVSIDIDGDNARVTMTKPDLGNGSVIEVDFKFNQADWLIVDDTIIGSGGILERYAGS